MENSAYLQRLTPLIQRGIRASAAPILLVNIFFALLISIVIDATEPNRDFTLRDGIFLALLNIGLFLFVSFTGILLIGLVLALWNKRISSVLATSLGFGIGLIPLTAGNFILWNLFFLPPFRDFETFLGQFLPIYFLPNIANILIIAKIGRKMNYSESWK